MSWVNLKRHHHNLRYRESREEVFWYQLDAEVLEAE